MSNNSNRVKYTREHIEFILKNYVTNPKLCKEVTGHSESSIKMMLGNAVSRLSGGSAFLGAELYAKVVLEYLEANTQNGRPMSIEKFKALFL
tara:strand:- start:1335 stop:1610 length:276 start_codon:yes stop_codon:yes gene_type:complete